MHSLQRWICPVSSLAQHRKHDKFLMWAVAVWNEGEEEYDAVVPSTWISENEKKIWWPSEKKYATKLLTTRADPDKATWLVFDLLKVKYKSDSKSECCRYNETSSVTDEDVDEAPVAKRMIKRRVYSDFTDDFSSGAETPKKILEFPKLLKKMNYSPKKDLLPSTDSRCSESNIPQAQVRSPDRRHSEYLSRKGSRQRSRSGSRQRLSKDKSPRRSHYSSSSRTQVRTPDRHKSGYFSCNARNGSRNTRSRSGSRQRLSKDMSPRRLHRLPSTPTQVRTPDSLKSGYLYSNTRNGSRQRSRSGSRQRLFTDTSPQRSHYASSTPKSRDVQDYDNRFYKVEKKLEKVEKKLEKVEKKLDEITRLLKRNLSKVVELPKQLTAEMGKKATADEEILDILNHPMKKMEEFNDREELLANDDYKNRLINQLAQIGGNNPRDCIYKMLSRLLTNKLMEQFNFAGNNRKDVLQKKRGFGETKMYSAIKAAVLRTNPNVTENDIKEFTMKYLKNAAGRQGGRLI